MRIRSTKPEFWRSKKIADVSWDARLVLKGLESYVDDNGVGKDDLELIASDIFSRDTLRDPSRTLARVSEAISELFQAHLVARYDHDGEPLVYIVDWKTAQRIDKPAKGRFPRPDGTMDYTETVDPASLKAIFASPREDSRALAPGTGEQGNRGTGEQAKRPSPTAQVALRGDEPTPQTLVAEWIDHCDTRPPSRVIGQISKEIKTMFDDGTHPDQIRNGLAEWQRKALHPSTLASVVHETASKKTRSTTNERVGQALALAERFEAEESA